MLIAAFFGQKCESDTVAETERKIKERGWFGWLGLVVSLVERNKSQLQTLERGLSVSAAARAA